MSNGIASENVDFMMEKPSSFAIDEQLMSNVIFHETFNPFASIGHAVCSVVDTAATLPPELQIKFLTEVADRLIEHADAEVNTDPAPMGEGERIRLQRERANVILLKCGVEPESNAEAFNLIRSLGYIWEDSPGWWTRPEYAESNVEPVDADTMRRALVMFRAVGG